MFIFRRLPLLVLWLIISGPAYTQTWDVKTVLDRLIHTYGGEKNLRKMDNMTQEWVVVASMGNRHGTDVRRVHAPRQLRVDLSYPDKSETRILNGDVGHTIFGDAPPELVTGMQLDAMRLQLMRLYSPLMLRNKIDSIGLTEEGGLLAL
jgi:hypothetical protein